MADRVGLLDGEHAAHRLWIDDVGDVQWHARGQVVAGAAGKVVEHRDGMPFPEERVDDVAADESGTAGDQNLHVSRLLLLWLAET